MHNNHFSGFVLVVLSVLLCTSCKNLTPFTSSLHEQYQWTEDELRRIQFYTSEPIVLRRELSSGTKEIIRGDIKVVDGREVEIITIPKGTEGIFEFRPGDDRLAIRFEEGGEDRFLMFGPNPRYGDRYMLLASEWNRSTGKVSYDGITYETYGGSIATLLINLKRIGQTNRRTRTVEGVKVPR